MWSRGSPESFIIVRPLVRGFETLRSAGSGTMAKGCPVIAVSVGVTGRGGPSQSAAVRFRSA